MTNQLRGEANQKTHETAVGTSAGASATLTAVTGTKTVVTHVSGSSDLAALVTVESPSGTVLWQKRFGAAFSFSESFKYGEYEAAAGADVLVKVSASTTNSEANIAGVLVGI